MKDWLKLVFLAVGAMALAAGALASCGDDSEPGSDAPTGGLPDASTADAPGGGSEDPTITSVAWGPMGTCQAGTQSSYTVTIMATDPDTSGSQLITSGSVSSCNGNFNGTGVPKTFTISCPNANPYNGSIMVRDPQNNTDSLSFTISVCQSGSEP